MSEPIVAVIFDCDDTLGADTISFMLQQYGIDPQGFWDEIGSMVKDGWDPPQAYMSRILEYVQDGKIKSLNRRDLRKIGKKLPLFPGVPRLFGELRKFISKNQQLKNAHIYLEFYIISGGLEEVIRGSKLAKDMNGIFGCNFLYSPKTGPAVAIKSLVSFTEKTKFVFAINKGISEDELRIDPYRVNDSVSETERRVPFKNMIYVGDGPSDIPCLSMITYFDGKGIGASPPTKTFRKGYELARGKRITVGPYTADYRRGTDMRKALEEIILTAGLDIVFEMRKHTVPAPIHS